MKDALKDENPHEAEGEECGVEAWTVYYPSGQGRLAPELEQYCSGLGRSYRGGGC